MALYESFIITPFFDGQFRGCTDRHHGPVAQRKSIRLISERPRYRNSLGPPDGIVAWPSKN